MSYTAWTVAPRPSRPGGSNSSPYSYAAACIADGKLPRSAISMGGRYVETPDYMDQAQTPNFQLAVLDYGGPQLVFEVRGLVGKKGPTGKDDPRRIAHEFYFEAGAIIKDRFLAKGKKEGEPLPDVPMEWPTKNNFENFINCVRSRKPENLQANIEDAHYSCAAIHLSNASYRLG